MATEDSAAYDAVEAQRTALGHQLFELMVMDAWYGALGVTLRDYPTERGADFIYHAEPVLADEFGRHYLGGDQLTRVARQHKAEALGQPIDDNRLKKLIEEVLRDELDKYGIVLQWHTRHNWDGSDRVLFMYHQSEDIPSAT